MLKKLITVFVVIALCMSMFIGCSDGRGTDGDRDENGNYRPSADGTVLQFWGYGDDAETKVFGDIVNAFNGTIGKELNIKVEYTSVPTTNYTESAGMALSDNNPPDIVYVEDKFVKSWAEAGYLEPLDAKETDGGYKYPGLEEFLGGNVWEQGIARYRYNPETTTSNENDTLWALPKDIGPTVIYYNKTYMDQLDIEIISMTEEEVAAYNEEHPTAKYPYKGYFTLNGKRYFNNRIAMNWEEVIELAQLMQKNIPGCDYGFFTEWWFSYGWSVGGDCVEYTVDENNKGYYKFTLNDDTYNYIVKDDYEGELQVGENVYKAGEIISYTDKQSAGNWKANCNQLPSMKDAFLEFCALTTPEGKNVGTRTDGSEQKGYAVSMGATSLGSSQAEDFFATGKFGMFVDGRWEVTGLRENMTAGTWDVAPLPVYKEYNDEGEVTVHGVKAGHSGSVGLAIAQGSKRKNAAWEFLKFVAGEEGQTSQSEAGFCIPNQKDIANSEVFLQSGKDPANSIVFVEAAEYETPGDWWYLKDSLWIDEWANFLNYQVREGKNTVDELFSIYGESTQQALYKYTNYQP